VSVSPDSSRHCQARPVGVIACVRLLRLTVRPLSSVLRACVRPSGSFESGTGLRRSTPGSCPALLRPLLTSPSGRRRCHRRFLTVTRKDRTEISPSKGVNLRCTTPCFTCGGESRTSLCCASSSPPSASLHVSVRGLAVLTTASFPRYLAAPQLPSSNACILNSRIEDFHLLVHSHVGHTQATRGNGGEVPAFQAQSAALRPSPLNRSA